MLRAMTAPVTHVLVVEDEAAIAETVLYALRSEGYAASHCLLGGLALQQLQAGDIDLVVLDVGLPDLSGFEVCRRLRALPGPVAQVPVIFLTARNDEVDRVLGLELGADDYIGKPFSPRELVARVRARLRRRANEGLVQVRGRFELDPEGHRIRYAGQALDLTRHEYGLLAELLRRPGAILSRAQLLDRAWEAALESGERTVDTHVKTLRAKLRAVVPDSDPIRTHRGVGYSLDVD
jgi:two-component system catabolic regulation response regulator CreB